MNKLWGLILVVAVAMSVFAVAQPADATVLKYVNPHAWSRVTDVVDGDTIHVAYGSNKLEVRFIGVNTPEIAHGGWGSNECGGQTATAKLRTVLHPGALVHLTRVAGRDNFSYGRALRYVSYRGHDVGAWEIWTGYGRAAYDFGHWDTHPKRAWYHSIDWRHNISKCAYLRRGALGRGIG